MAIAEARRSHDLVLLDVDNGPGYLVHDDNAGLYSRDMLERCHGLLNPGGVLVVWAANRAADLLAELRVVFGDAEERACDVLLQDRPEQYYLYLARRQA
jgi:spermidine synthase